MAGTGAYARVRGPRRGAAGDQLSGSGVAPCGVVFVGASPQVEDVIERRNETSLEQKAKLDEMQRAVRWEGGGRCRDHDVGRMLEGVTCWCRASLVATGASPAGAPSRPLMRYRIVPQLTEMMRLIENVGGDSTPAVSAASTAAPAAAAAAP